MPRRRGKRCAAALDGIVPQANRRQEPARWNLASQPPPGQAVIRHLPEEPLVAVSTAIMRSGEATTEGLPKKHSKKARKNAADFRVLSFV
jgi:hypothetical protein